MALSVSERQQLKRAREAGLAGKPPPEDRRGPTGKIVSPDLVFAWAEGVWARQDLGMREARRLARTR